MIKARIKRTLLVGPLLFVCAVCNDLSEPLSTGGSASLVAALEPRQVELYHWYDFMVDAPSASGNLFDIVAEVDWTHEDEVTVREGQAFYTGTGHTFAFRFGAERFGTWTGATTSAVPELDGLELTIEVRPPENANRSGFHVFDPQNPTLWLQQAGPAGNTVRIAPRLVMWDGVEHFWNDLPRLQRDVDTWADDFGFTGAHQPDLARKWFDVESDVGHAGRSLDDLTSAAVPDPRTFAALEELIDRWLDKGGMVHIWMWMDEEPGRNGAPVNLPGGFHGTVARRLDRYISARLGPVPGWSMGLGFDSEEYASASDVAQWAERLATRIGWHHWFGARYGQDLVTTAGGYTAEGVGWNTTTSAPPQYASWTHIWPWVAERDENPTPEEVTLALRDSADNGFVAVPDRPAFAEDRFRRRDIGSPADFEDDDEVPAVLRGYGFAGWAAIYGKLDPVVGDPDNHYLTSDPFSNVADVKQANDQITAAMRGTARDVVSGLRVASGEPYRLFDLEHRENLYIDRDTLLLAYRDEFPLGLGGAVVAVRTANDDKFSTGPRFLTFDLAESATVYVAHDDFVKSKPSWLTDEFTPTGEYLHNSLQLWSKTVPAGTVTLGGNVPFGGTDRAISMYTVLVVPNADADGLVSNLSVASGKPYELFDLAHREPLYIDRDLAALSYRGRLPLGLSGEVAVRTANEDKFSTGSGFLTFDLAEPATVYVAHDDFVKSKPEWLTNEFTPTGEHLHNSLQLWSKRFPAGTVTLGGNVPFGWSDRAISMYTVIIGP